MKTAIVIPCYNEEHRLSIDKIDSFIKNQKEVCLYFVNDGSKDRTLEVLTSLQKKHPGLIEIVHLKENRGKAEAVRMGMLAAHAENKYEYLMFLDADFSTSLEECIRFVGYAENNSDVKVVCGCRIKRMGADIRRTPKRHYIGRVFASLTYLVLPLPMYDTQCGAKLFRSEIIPVAFSQPFTSKWLFDIEILLKTAVYLGYERSLREIYEIPLLKWIEIGGSKINFRSSVSLPLDLLRIYLKYKTQVRILSKALKSQLEER